MIFNKLLTDQKLVHEKIMRSIKNSEPLLMTYLNQHCYNIYKKNNTYKKLLNEKFSVFLDGYGLYTALRFLGFNYVQKFNATDFYMKIFQHFSDNHIKVFILGGKFNQELIGQKSEENNLLVTGYRNGYFGEIELENVLREISECEPNVIVIGMGVPRQEVLAEKISMAVDNKVILCVGRFLEFYFETIKRAPRFFRMWGFEWLHRLLSEPGRLWRRYILGIPLFLFYVARIKISILAEHK